MNNSRFLIYYDKLKGKINKKQFYLQRDKFLQLKKSQQIIITLILLAVIWLFVGLLLPRDERMKELEVAQAKVIFIEPVVENKKRQIRVHSIAIAENKVELFAPNKGVVYDIKVAKGQQVRKHQELAVISPLDYFQILSTAQNKVRELEEIIGAEEVQSIPLAKALTSAKQELERAKNYSKNMIIRSPLEGRVQKSNISLGDHIGPEQELFQVIDAAKLKFQAYLSEHEHRQLGADPKAIILDGRGVQYEGKIGFISAAANPENLSFEIEVIFDNKEGKIKEGTGVEILLSSKEMKTYKLPLSALVISPSGDIGVMLYNAGEARAYFQKVEIVDQDENSIWVSGVSDSPKVITMGQTSLANGSKVKAKLAE